MHTLFADMFNREPNHIIDGDYYFGDAPSEVDEKIVEKQTEITVNMMEQKRKKTHDQWRGISTFAVCDDIATQIAEEGKPFMEIASARWFGLAPAVFSKNPTIPCLVTDISSGIVQFCRQYANLYLPETNISLAALDATKIPIKDNSLDYVTSILGLGSPCVRNEKGLAVVNEVYRVLKSGGILVTEECEWEYNEAAAEWVRLAQESPETELTEFMRSGWEYLLYRKGLTWTSVLEAAGFVVEREQSCGYIKTKKRDVSFPDRMETIHLSSEHHHKRTLFIARKP